MRRSKPKDDARLREHKKYLGLTVLARRGDTFRQSQVRVKFFWKILKKYFCQVIEIRDDGWIGVMMKGDTNLTFFLQPEVRKILKNFDFFRIEVTLEIQTSGGNGPKSPRDGLTGVNSQEVCMLIDDQFDQQVTTAHFC